MKNLKLEFAKGRIPKCYLKWLYKHLMDISPTKKLYEIREESLRNVIIEVVKKSLISEEIMNDYKVSKRVAKPLEATIYVRGSDIDRYLGIREDMIKDSIEFSVPITSNMKIPEYRTKDQIYLAWNRATIYLNLDKITDKNLKEKLVQIFISYRKAKFNLIDFLKIEYNYTGENNYYVFLKNYTWEKLYNLNKEWFNWLVDFSNMPKESIYESEENIEPDYSKILGELKLYLEN